jgi:hypothetical protein
MTTAGKALLVKLVLVVLVIGALISIAVIISSFVVGVGTDEGARLSRLGSTLMTLFVVPIFLVTALVVHWRRKTNQE